MPLEEIYALTMIDPYFLQKFKNLADYEEKLAKEGATKENILEGKHPGKVDSH